MGAKKVSSQVFSDIESKLEIESHTCLDKLAVKISLKDMTQAERMQEASKPLYLKRYE